MTVKRIDRKRGNCATGVFAGSLALLLVLALLGPVSDVAYAQTSGHKQTAKLVSKSQSTIGSMRAARLQVENTLNGYNAIIDGEVDDNIKAYKKLQKDINKSEKAREDVRKKMDAMQVEADILFTDWESSLADITSDDLRQRSEARLNDTKSRYDGILKEARATGEQVDPFLTHLKDQVVFLGYDLNPSAIADLKGDAKKLNNQADKVFAGVDKSIDTAAKYANSLKPE